MKWNFKTTKTKKFKLITRHIHKTINMRRHYFYNIRVGKASLAR